MLVAGGEAWHPPASSPRDVEVHAEEERWSPWAIGHAESEDGSDPLAPHGCSSARGSGGCFNPNITQLALSKLCSAETIPKGNMLNS